MTSGPPPGIERTSSPRGNTSRSKSLLMAAITLGTFGVGNSVLVGPVVTSPDQGCSNLNPTSQYSLNESVHFETLQTVGLNHVKLPDFEDIFIDQHLTVASSVDTSWILFDSGAAANCCPKNFAPEWPLPPITGTKPPLRSVTGQPLKIYGRKLVGMTSGSHEVVKASRSKHVWQDAHKDLHSLVPLKETGFRGSDIAPYVLRYPGALSEYSVMLQCVQIARRACVIQLENTS